MNRPCHLLQYFQRGAMTQKDTIIVEPTSGNQGIGLALIGAVKGYETVIITQISISGFCAFSTSPMPVMVPPVPMPEQKP